MMRLTVFLVFGFLAGCSSPRGAAVVQPQQYTIGDAIDTTAGGASIATMAATIAPYRDQLSEEMGRVIGRVATPMTKGRPESSLGNWVADLLEEAATDLFPDKTVAFAVQNYGGIRVGEIQSGPLTVAEIFELMPFDNELVLVELTGTDLQIFVDYMVAGGGWPVSSGLSVSTRSGEQNVTVNGVAIVGDERYYVALPDYVAGGGDGADFFIGKPLFPSDRMIRDLLIEYAAKGDQPIDVTSTGKRFTIE